LGTGIKNCNGGYTRGYCPSNGSSDVIASKSVTDCGYLVMFLIYNDGKKLSNLDLNFLFHLLAGLKQPVFEGYGGKRLAPYNTD